MVSLQINHAKACAGIRSAYLQVRRVGGSKDPDYVFFHPLDPPLAGDRKYGIATAPKGRLAMTQESRARFPKRAARIVRGTIPTLICFYYNHGIATTPKGHFAMANLGLYVTLQDEKILTFIGSGKITFLNSVASAFPVAYCGVSKRLQDYIVP